MSDQAFDLSRARASRAAVSGAAALAVSGTAASRASGADNSAPPAAGGGSTALAGVGLVGGLAALLDASCCVLPVVLTMAGLGGSWLAVLGVFVAWSWYLLAGAGAAIAAAWAIAVRRRAATRVHVLLGIASVVFAAAVLTVLYEVEINRYVLAMWRGA